jgi:hypothetical protein
LAVAGGGLEVDVVVVGVFVGALVVQRHVHITLPHQILDHRLGLDDLLDAEMGLRYKVTEWASLNLKAERDIISGDSDSSLSKTRYTAGFGVAW